MSQLAVSVRVAKVRRVTVITGASSGLGRATALELARRGDLVVLGARRGDVLAEVADACRRAGGDAVAVTCDVTRELDVERLAAAAIARGGRIDAWVNNAGVTAYSSLERGAFEIHRRVIETNLFGAILGARAAIPIFRRQGEGVLINVGSVLSKIGHAFVPSYVISKFGVQGLSEALRVELADQPGIRVCTVLPYAIDTPHFQVAAKHIANPAYALPPVQSPEKVARAIAGLIDRPRRVRFVPRYIALGVALHMLMPRTVERVLLDALRRWHLAETTEPQTTGNLFDPVPHGTTTHGDRGPRLSTARLLVWAALRALHVPLPVPMPREAR